LLIQPSILPGFEKSGGSHLQFSCTGRCRFEN